jgi:phosphoribosylanthranilate isomerase
MIVQIYEVNNPDEAKKLVQVGVDNIGVLVGNGDYPRELSSIKAKEIFEALPENATCVALSLSDNIGEIAKLIRECNPDILHLGANPEKLGLSGTKKLKKLFPNIKFMRAIPVVDIKSIELAKSYDRIVDCLLLDTYNAATSQVGAAGKPHDWNISRKIVELVKIPVILAGGLGPDNVADAIRMVGPAGVDSKTKTDRVDGKGKDIDKVRQFVKTAKSVKWN